MGATDEALGVVPACVPGAVLVSVPPRGHRRLDRAIQIGTTCGSMMRPAVFLDRDGTVMRDEPYLRAPERVVLLPTSADALRRFRAAGFACVLVSNQSGVGRGLIPADALRDVHARLLDLLGREGASLDGAYYCPHAPEAACTCRKPAPGLLHRAASELGLDLRRSWMVGDRWSDVEAGRRAGCRAVLLSEARPEGVDCAPDLLAAARLMGCA